MAKNTNNINRVAVLKSLILSKFIHLWILLPNPPDNLVDALQKTVFQLVWNRKQDRISRKLKVKTIAKGGVGIPNIRHYINALKLRKRILIRFGFMYLNHIESLVIKYR